MCFECDITLESVCHIKIRVLVLKCKGEKTYTELHIQSEREVGCSNGTMLKLAVQRKAEFLLITLKTTQSVL